MSLIALAQEYFKSQPVSDVLGYWIHTDFVKESNSMSATKWHFDMDRVKWIKVFFYLSDMDTERGPHCYVRGSHKTGGIPPELLKRGYARVEDHEVEKFYKKEDIIEVVGKKGTIVAVDTRGLHKGKYLLKDHRVLFQMNFSDSLFGGAYDRHNFPKDICSELKQTIADYPRVFAKYMN
jgi:ectoine hydroxylase-related dioxygenase (phytanoyl-CoA dioxygenase family)